MQSGLSLLALNDSAFDAPGLIRWRPVVQLGRLEPEADLELGGFSRIRPVDHVAADVDSQITADGAGLCFCLLYTSPSPRDATLSRMPSSA